MEVKDREDDAASLFSANKEESENAEDDFVSRADGNACATGGAI